MFQTTVISDKILKLGNRSYSQRMDIALKDNYNRIRLLRLNKDLEYFYEFLYSNWREIEPVKVQGIINQLDILLSTLQDLLYTYRSFSEKGEGIDEEIIVLDRNFKALMELKNDIENVKIKFPIDKDLKTLLTQADLALKSVFS